MANKNNNNQRSKIDLKVLQLNLNNNWGSKNLLEQQVNEFGFAIALISEPPKSKKDTRNWWYNKQRNAAIYCNLDKIKKITLMEIEENYVMVEVEGIVMTSFYFSPNQNVIKYKEALTELEVALNKYRGRGVIIGGDFNARSTLWGDKINNKRGTKLIE